MSPSRSILLVSCAVYMSGELYPGSIRCLFSIFAVLVYRSRVTGTLLHSGRPGPAKARAIAAPAQLRISACAGVLFLVHFKFFAGTTHAYGSYTHSFTPPPPTCETRDHYYALLSTINCMRLMFDLVPFQV